jgi:hypothetical protein
MDAALSAKVFRELPKRQGTGPSGDPISPEGPGFRHRGVDVSLGKIVVEDWDSAHFLSLAPNHMGAISLTPMDPAAAGRALVGREFTAPSLPGGLTAISRNVRSRLFF